MTQKFYLRNVLADNAPTAGETSTALPVDTLGANNASGTDETRSLLSAIGSAQTSLSKNSDNTTSARDNYLARFTSVGLSAGTYGSGTWTVALALNEENVQANSFLNCSIYFWRPSNNSVVGYVYDSHTNIGSEWANAETGEVNNITGSNVTIQDNDVLVIEIWRHATQGMTTAYTQTVYFDGTTDPTDGTATSDAASYINAPADIPEYVAPVTYTENTTKMMMTGVGQ